MQKSGEKFFKKTLSATLCLLMLLGIIPNGVFMADANEAVAFNIITDGGFETADSINSWSSEPAGYSITLSTEEKHSGQNALKLAGGDYTAYKYVEKLEPNAQYTLGFYYNGPLSYAAVVDAADSITSNANKGKKVSGI